MHETVTVRTNGQGLYEFTNLVDKCIQTWDIESGLCTVFVKHTSASLIIQENADPSARRDLESWIRRFVPENESWYTHTHEGSDDMPAHIKAAITATSLSIPICNSDLCLGTWQGIYLWEHRDHPHDRKVMIQAIKA